MSDYIYSRVSTDGQSCDAQLIAVTKNYPAAEVITETVSGAKRRPELEALVARLESGDRLIVAALDRLGRRTAQVLTLIEALVARGVILISVREGIDYSTIAGRLVTQILVAVAEMERSVIGDRIKQGMQARKARGLPIGAKPTYSSEEIASAMRLLAAGKSSREVEKITGISYARLNELRRNAVA